MTTLAELIREQIIKDDPLSKVKEGLIKALMTNIRAEGETHIRYVCEEEEGVEKPSYSKTYYIRIWWRHETALKMWLDEQGFRYHDTYAWRTGIKGLDVSV